MDEIVVGGVRYRIFDMRRCVAAALGQDELAAESGLRAREALEALMAAIPDEYAEMARRSTWPDDILRGSESAM